MPAEFFILLFAAAAGVAAGIITGILPGLHINLVAVAVSSMVIAKELDPVAVAVFIISMSISHVFHEFVPSVFLGFSESESALSVLPGHRMLMKGQGRKAVMLASFGALSGTLALIMISPLLLIAIKPVFSATKSHIALILIGVIAVHFIKCGKKPKALAINATVLFLSGAFGLAVFSLPNLKEPLLPMFSGLFGLSSIIGGLLSGSSFPVQQKAAAIKAGSALKVAKLASVGLFSSSLMGMFPALGPAQAAMLGTASLRKLKAPAYMFLLGTIASASMLFALLTLYSFGKARNGSIAVMGELLEINLASASLLLAVAAVAASAACITVAMVSKLFVMAAGKMNYCLISWLTIAFIIAFVALISGIIGLLVLATATAIGMVPVLTRSSRQLLMGCLMVPVIGHYL